MSRAKQGGARTAVDEYKYDEQLRREEDIKTEVIVHLRSENKSVYESNGRLLSSLINTSELLVQCIENLRIYREQALKFAERATERGGGCAATCTRHEWDSTEGWQRKEATR